MFTYSNKRPSPTFSKLDRIFTTHDWNNIRGTPIEATVKDMPTTISDHTLLLLTIKPMRRHKTRIFKFERYWLQFSETREIVKKAWQISNPSSILAIDYLRRLNSTRKALKAWATKKFAQIDNLLSTTNRIIQALDKAEEHRSLEANEFAFRLKLREH
jgi:hypothetical protein